MSTPIRNLLGSEVTPIDKARLFEVFDNELQGLIESKLARPDVLGMVVFENLQMDSSNFGAKQGMIYGPGCVNKTAKELCLRRLGDVPSCFGYATKIFIKEVA